MAKGGLRNYYLFVCALILIILGLLVSVIILAARSGATEPPCERPAEEQKMSISKALYGTINGTQVYLFTLKNNFAEVRIINYGGIITNIFVPDRNGKVEDITLGFDATTDYETNSPYFGCIVGRYANRIAKGEFSLDGVKYKLAVNNGPNALHGGLKGFDKAVWTPEVVDNMLVLSYTSEDGEEGYPGEVKVTVTYRLTDENELIIDYRANTTKATVINLTNHAYFNLAGHGSGKIDEHTIRMSAEQYTPTDNTSIPVGTIDSVAGTMFDLRADTQLGPRLPRVPGDIGFDINYALGKPGWDKHVARVVHPPSGRRLDIYSTEPGVQFYTAYYLDNVKGKGGAVYNKYGAFCLEAQHYPDSPNEPRFPSTILRPGEEYKQTTKYVFSIEE